MKKLLLLLLLTGCVTACTPTPERAYRNPGTPENLVDISRESITLPLSEPAHVEALLDWVNREVPVQAELRCAEGAPVCERARDVLAQFSVPYTQQGGQGSVILRYSRVSLHDCDNRFVNNTSNAANLNHPAFGCSVEHNIVRNLRDTRQLVAPEPLGLADGEKAAQNYREYEKSSSTRRQANQPPSLLGITIGN